MGIAVACVIDTPRKRGVHPKLWCTPQLYILQRVKHRSQETFSSLRQTQIGFTKIANNIIHRMLVDNGSATNILFWNAYQKIGQA